MMIRRTPFVFYGRREIGHTTRPRQFNIEDFDRSSDASSATIEMPPAAEPWEGRRQNEAF